MAIAQSQTKKVLFIGNSYTFTNNLPELVEQMATSTGNVLVHDVSAGPGMGLQDHAVNATTLSKINADNWDYVVLQERSQTPAFPLGYLQTFVYPNAQSLNNAITTNNACTETVFFITWGWENGDTQFCSVNPPSCTYESMDNLVTQRILEMANNYSGIASPAGPLWRYLRENHPDIQLYDTDGSHPSLAGSYAAACSFYTVLFRNDPTLISYDAGLPSNVVTAIREAAKTIVFNQLSTWKVGSYDPVAAFTATQTGPGQYQFTNLSQQADNYQWDFGNGQTSNEQNPVHTYLQSGDYTVTLTAGRCNTQTTFSVNLEGVLSINAISHSTTKLVPNPTEGSCQIMTLSPIALKEIFSTDGRLLMSLHNDDPHIDLTGLKTGLYIVRLTDTQGRVLSTPVVKK